jgi:hypothetical protein
MHEHIWRRALVQQGQQLLDLPLAVRPRPLQTPRLL